MVVASYLTLGEVNLKGVKKKIAIAIEMASLLPVLSLMKE